MDIPSATIPDETLKALQKELHNKYKDDPLYAQIAEKYKTKGYKLEYIDFIEIYQNNKLCEGCNGLFMCKQKNKGFRLDFNGKEMIYSGCKYMQEKDQLKKTFKNLVYSTFEFEQPLPKLTDIEVKGEDRMAISKYMMELIKDYQVGEFRAQGFYLHGSPGVGKTFVMQAFMNALMELGYKCAYVAVNELYLKIQKAIYSYDNDDAQTINNLFLKLKNVEFLFIDDIGIEKADMNFRDTFLMPLLDIRMKLEKPTFFTSNVSIEELNKHYRINTGQTPNNITKGNYVEERVKALAKQFELVGDKSKRY